VLCVLKVPDSTTILSKDMGLAVLTSQGWLSVPSVQCATEEILRNHIEAIVTKQFGIED
jgi:hypothetical protein